MSDAVEAAWQDVGQEAPPELVGRQRHDLLAIGTIAAIVLVPERHASLVKGDQPPVRDGNTVRVAREIGQHRLWPGEGRLGIEPTQRFFRSGDRCRRKALRAARLAKLLKKASLQASNSANRRVRNSRRNNAPSTRTGSRKAGREDTGPQLWRCSSRPDR